ncbi:MAG: helicase associated domain-containing protein [Bacteroidales bacterium]|nr:helicase associated domain-containing protein [Bacteroidales bacterium]
MTQDELWKAHYQEYFRFIETNHRNPSKHYAEERKLHTWWKHNRKLVNAGKMDSNRLEKFNALVALSEKNHHINQYK